MNIPYVMKKCSKCGEWKVASTINFHRSNKGRYGLATQCKECRNKYGKRWREANKEKRAKYNKQYRQNNKEKIAEYRKQYYETNKEKEAEQNKQYYEANKDKILEQQKQWKENNKEKIAERNKQYRQDNKEKIAERNKQYRENNKEKEAERVKQWYEDNKDRKAEYYKQWCQTPQGQVVRFNSSQRRRVKEEQQGSGITTDQWLEMMSFFGWKCAYSGEKLTKDNRSVDHIVPLNSNGDNMIWNCVPMKINYNSSKHAKDMLEWYKEQSFYDPKRLQKIYEWQEYAYNKYGKDSEYFNSGDIQIKLI